MKKKQLFRATTLVFLLLISTGAFSQEDKSKLKKTTSFNIGPRISLAAADLADTHSWGIGLHSQVVHHIGANTSLTGSVSYTYLFGKSHSSSTYVPGGGNYESTSKYKGMSDVGITGGIRQDLNEHLSVGGEAGVCLGFSGGKNESSMLAWFEFLYSFGDNDNTFAQALAPFIGICGDPKIQIGIRYVIRL